MSTEPPSISITLSPVQVDEIVRAVSNSRTPSLATLIAESLGAPRATTESSAPQPEERDSELQGEYMPSDTTDPRLSRSLLRGLSILTRFGPSGESRGIVELASDLDMSPSTAHRYAQTLIELGLLERCPNSRKYRLPSLPS